MKRMKRRSLARAALFCSSALVSIALVPSLAQAQGALQQLGPAHQGQIPVYTDSGHLIGSGGAPFAGGTPVNPATGLLPGGLALANPGQPLALYSGYSSAAYSQFLFGFDGNGNGLITFGRVGDSLTPNLSFSINGTLRPFPGSLIPLRAANPLNFYVATNGNDGNDCLAATLGSGHGPCQTVQHTVQVALTTYDAGANVMIVNLAAGTYNSGFLVTGPITGGGSAASFDGSFLEVKGAGSSTTIINDTSSGRTAAITVSAGMVVVLTGLTVETNQSGASDVFVQNMGLVESGPDMVYAAPSPTGENIHTEWGGMFEAYASFHVGGNAAAALFAGGAIIEIDPNGLTITVDGHPTYTQGFAWIAQNGKFYAGLATYTGPANGTPALVATGGVIDGLNSNLPTYFPGNGPPIVTSGGIYASQEAPFLNTLSAGAGSTGTLAAAAGSDASSGDLIVSPSGSGITSSFNVNVNLPFVPFKNNQTAHCQITPSDEGSGQFSGAAGLATLQTSPITITGALGNLSFVVANGGSTNFTSGQNYHILYNCPIS